MQRQRALLQSCIVRDVADHFQQSPTGPDQIAQSALFSRRGGVAALQQFAHAQNSGERRVHVMTQPGHESAFHATGFLGLPATPGQIEGQPADGQHACEAQQRIEKAHIGLLPGRVAQIRCGVLTDADAAEHLAHAAVHMAAQTALLRHQHGEQAQAALPVLIRRTENFLAPLGAFDESLTLPGVGLIFRPQGLASDNGDADARPSAAFGKLAAHIGGIHQHQGAAVGGFQRAFVGRQPGIGPAVLAFRHIDPAVRRVPVARVQQLLGHGGKTGTLQFQAVAFIHMRGVPVEAQSQAQPEQAGQYGQPEHAEKSPG